MCGRLGLNQIECCVTRPRERVIGASEKNHRPVLHRFLCDILAQITLWSAVVFEQGVAEASVDSSGPPKTGFYEK